MDNDKKIKEIVKKKYAEIAQLNVLNKKESYNSCCQPADSGHYSNSCCGPSDFEIKVLDDDYKTIKGYVPDADLGLGCGIPSEYAKINKGDIVVDLGSGAGNDVFIARDLVGEEGRVIGVDMTEDMIQKANSNKEKLGFQNVEFRLGDIEALPVENDEVDVVVSNCVINLVPNKEQVYKEIYRILKPGAHFCISDIVTKGELPPALKHSAELYTGCVAGASDINQILDMIRTIGFTKIEINKEKEIFLNDDLLKEFLDDEELSEFRKNNIGIYSLTITAYK